MVTVAISTYEYSYMKDLRNLIPHEYLTRMSTQHQMLITVLIELTPCRAVASVL